MSLRESLTKDRGGGPVINANVIFYLTVAFVFTLAFAFVNGRLHPEIAAQREAIARAEQAEHAQAEAKERSFNSPEARQAREAHALKFFHEKCDDKPVMTRWCEETYMAYINR